MWIWKHFIMLGVVRITEVHITCAMHRVHDWASLPHQKTQIYGAGYMMQTSKNVLIYKSWTTVKVFWGLSIVSHKKLCNKKKMY